MARGRTLATKSVCDVRARLLRRGVPASFVPAGSKARRAPDAVGPSIAWTGGPAVIDDDRLIDVAGAVVALIVVAAIAVMILAGATAPTRQPAEPPQADWTISRVDEGQVAITHAGGEPVDADELVVSVAGVERATGRSDRLTEGESIQVPARAGQEVRLFWVAGRDERLLLARWEAP